MRTTLHPTASVALALLAALSLPREVHAQAPAAAPSLPTSDGGKHLPTELPVAPPISPSTLPDSPQKAPAKLSPGSKQPAETGKAIARKQVEGLTPADLDTIVSAVKDRYVAPDALSETDLKRDMVEGMLDRLGPGVSVLSQSVSPDAEAAPVKSETLESKTGYLRLGTLNPPALTETIATLKKFSTDSAPALILDLRAIPAGTDFEAAADVLRLFCPKGKLLFTVQKPKAKAEIFTSKDDPLWRGILVVLVSSQSSGNAEIMAGALRSLANAMIIGQPTKGEAAEFAEVPLSGGRRLHLAIAQAVLPDNLSFVPQGLKPDLPVEASVTDTATVLKQELEKGAASLAAEPHYVRMNEAALVAGTNPDLDQVIADQHKKGEKSKAPLRDVVLQRALDFITTISVYHAAGKGE